jgi:hypothetical protein
MIKLSKENASEATLEQVKTVFEKYLGKCPSYLKLQLDNEETGK